jgi:hypothetical protein
MWMTSTIMADDHGRRVQPFDDILTQPNDYLGEKIALSQEGPD